MVAERRLSVHRSADLPVGATDEPLQQTLERTGFRASLAPQYVEGHAPDRQRKEGNTTPPTYYDLPAIKKPEWKWPVPAYFFLGGLSSGAYIVAALVDLTGRPEDRVLRRAGRYLQFAALLPCPVLLIADLGRPERFHHMLRVFRPRSMMNQGSWGLTLYSLFSGAAVAAQLAEDLAPGSRLLRFLRLPLRAVTAASAIELGRLSKPLRTGPHAKAYQIGALGLGTVLPLALHGTGKRAPWLRLLRSALALVGSAITKYTITEAGKQSADDPRAY